MLQADSAEPTDGARTGASVPLAVTVAVAKLASAASRVLRRGAGSALPGLVAERLDPGVLRRLGERLVGDVVLVTGTNGKTTTSKMIATGVEGAGGRVLRNAGGSNLSRGLVSSLVARADWRGRLPEGIAIFEVDEAALPAVARALQPRLIVVLNLFRDQLDRYGEIDRTARLIGDGIAACDADVLLNADDPLVAALAPRANGRVHTFGVDHAQTLPAPDDHTREVGQCPECGAELTYGRVFFAHLGHWRCPEGGHVIRPDPQVAVTRYLPQGIGGAHLEVRTTRGRTRFELSLPGLYNAYNAVAAIAATDLLGFHGAARTAALAHVDAAFGRAERVPADGRTVTLLLVKNPTGFDQTMRTFLLTQRETDVLVAINDHDADGRDVSWLWDTAVEALAPQGHRITVSGTRAADMALRLKYAGLEVAGVEVDLATAIDRLVARTPVGATAYVLATYTAMLQVRDVLGRRAELEELTA